MCSDVAPVFSLPVLKIIDEPGGQNEELFGDDLCVVQTDIEVTLRRYKDVDRR